MAFAAQGWQRCVLHSPSPDAIFPLVGEMALCRHAVVGPLRLPREAGAGGETGVFTHLEVWAPNMPRGS